MKCLSAHFGRPSSWTCSEYVKVEVLEQENASESGFIDPKFCFLSALGKHVGLDKGKS